MKCAVPGCDCEGPMYIHARCHPSAAIEAILHKDKLTIKCARCKKLVVELTVEQLRFPGGTAQ